MKNYMGDTFVAFIDISGFKELMRINQAEQALNVFYNAGYSTMENIPTLSGFFISDCGIIYNHTSNQTNLTKLKDMLKAIKLINLEMIDNNYMTFSSVAYGEFNYRERYERDNITKNLIFGRAYLSAYLDIENGKPKIKPGQCRILKNDLPSDIVNIIQEMDSITNQELIIKEQRKDQNHFYFYWMLNNKNQISSFEDDFSNAYNLQYQGMLNVLDQYSR